MSNKDLPFALIRWIQQQKLEAEEHRLYLIRKNWKDGDQYARYLSFLLREWKRLEIRDRQIVASFLKWREEKRNFSTAQKSVIAGLLISYDLVSDVNGPIDQAS